MSLLMTFILQDGLLFFILPGLLRSPGRLWPSSCKSQISAGGICRGIVVGKQPEGEISGPATAQRVLQIPPAECWDLQVHEINIAKFAAFVSDVQPADLRTHVSMLSQEMGNITHTAPRPVA